MALFDCSLSGNVDDNWLDNSKTEISHNSSTIEENVLTSMMKMVDDLILQGIKLIACQKVIHPTLQQYITRKRLYVIERLSICHIEAVQKLTGAKLLSSFQGKINENSFGSLAEIKTLVIHKKRYLFPMRIRVTQLLDDSVILFSRINSSEESYTDLKVSYIICFLDTFI